MGLASPAGSDGAGGVFVCFHLPNRYSLINCVARRIAKPYHLHHYTRGDIERLVSEAGG
jgi:hypothetical protein